MHSRVYTIALFPFCCCHTYVHVVMHSYIFPLLFTALFKLGLRFNFALKRNCCVVESVYCSCDLKNEVDNDVNDNNVRNVGNIFDSFHADDVVILCFLHMLLRIKRVIVACTMEAMVTALLLFVMVIMSFMLRLFLFFDFRS